MNPVVCGFIGLGLIGGSIAKALKESSEVIIYAYDKNPDTISAAAADGIVDFPQAEINASFGSCNIIFLCAPVSHNDENLLILKKFLSKDCILTDVGSVKADIHEAVKNAGLESCFIGGHPMAGSERYGYQNSKSRLLENAYYILTPTDQVSSDKIDFYRNLVKKIGAIPLLLNFEEHDFVTAAISHLPHIIASSLVNFVKDSDSPQGVMKMIAAGGFKDITRIASSSADMWQQICLTNTENISTLLGSYIYELCRIKEQLDSRDAGKIHDFFDSARMYRDSFINTSSGPIKKDFSITIDIPDKPGAIAAIATLFAKHQISIKNIGIVHNREYEEGILRIEFYSDSEQTAAEDLLQSKDYIIHEKK